MPRSGYPYLVAYLHVFTVWHFMLQTGDPDGYKTKWKLQYTQIKNVALSKMIYGYNPD